MCGICGTARPFHAPAGPAGGGPAAVAEVRGMVDRLAHRGPGDRWVTAAGDAVLGTARLHVTAREASSGPYTAARGQVVAAVNGEIWNHRDLRAVLAGRGVDVPDGADTAVVAPLYATFGLPGLSRLRGMFALAIHDARDGSTVLARDRFGIKPLYVQPGDPVRFASEPGVLPGSGAVDTEALRDYLALGFVPAPRTLDPAVRKVTPGTALRFRGGVVREVAFAPPPRPGAGDPVDPARLLEVLEHSVERHLMGEAPVGVYLSGGLDSAAVAALVARSGRPLRTFALTFPGEGRYDEGAAAARTAQALGARHVAVPLGPDELPALLGTMARHFGEPFGDSSALAVLALSRVAAREVTVVLTGTGADELFAGYRRYHVGDVPRWCALGARAVGALLPASRRTALGTAGDLARKLGRASTGTPAARYLAALETVPGPWRAALLGQDAPPPVLRRIQAAFDGAGTFADGARTADMAVYLPDDLLAKEDRATMAASLENRVPFLDDELALLAGSLPASAHRGAGPMGRGKTLLRQALRGVLPAEVLRRPKHGFAVPVSPWLRGPCRSLVDDLLLCPDARLADHVDRDAVVRLALRHRAGDDHLGSAVYALLALEACLALHHRGPHVA